MALRATAQCLSRHGFRPAAARDRLQPTAWVRADRPNDVMRQFNAIKRLARQNGTINRVFQLHRREFPSASRIRDMQHKIYFKKWHHMKYCCQVIQYSVRHGLRLRTEADAETSEAQANWAEGVSTGLLGSGRLTKEELQPALDFTEKAKSDGHYNAKRANDKGYGLDELRRLARSA